jgi:hypothetical protein
MIYQIKNLGNGWYDFSEVPQGYFKIHALNCGTRRKAINRLKEITRENKPEWVIETDVQKIWDTGRQI